MSCKPAEVEAKAAFSYRPRTLDANFSSKPHDRCAKLILLWIIFSTIGIAWASEVSGVVTDQLWTLDKSPYRVIGDLRVDSLQIQPGVIVEIASNAVIEVRGQLTAVGGPTRPIL